MGLFDWLFPPRRPGEVDTSEIVKQASEDATAPVRIAKGRGFTDQVAGESHYQDRLEDICGGKCEDGYNDEVTAQLVFISDNKHDPHAIGVMIHGQPVGFVPRSEAEQLRAEICRINPEQRPVICSAKIVGGWDRGDGDEGHFGVKLSLSKPLRLR